jgi:hypothetical protein
MENNIGKFEWFEYVLLNKQYSDLTASEKKELDEFCSSETEFIDMQLMMIQHKKYIESAKNLQVKHHIYSNLQQALNNKWNQTSIHLNSVLESLYSVFNIKNYLLKTSFAALSISVMLWFSFQSETHTNLKTSTSIIIADTSYKSTSCDTSYFGTKALAP